MGDCCSDFGTVEAEKGVKEERGGSRLKSGEFGISIEFGVVLFVGFELTLVVVV
ncbi:unnamed protein product [Rhodiola kirilowii]